MGSQPVDDRGKPSSVIPVKPTPTAAHGLPYGRIPVVDVTPAVDGGARPAKSVVGEEFTITAKVFREGHDAVNATAVLVDPDGAAHHFPMTCDNPGLSLWSAVVSADRTGWWRYRVEGWSDPYATWVHDATIKIEAGVDENLMLAEGVLVFDRIITHLESLGSQVSAGDLSTVRTARSILAAHPADALADDARHSSIMAALHAGTSAQVHQVMAAHPLREMVSGSPDFELLVERELALTGAWYEMFPRSEGAVQAEDGSWTSGTFATAAKRLPAIAAMGFDVVYLTPIHPIGTTARKGKNNTLTAAPGDPGSPYAIGSPDGGHDALHPDLGDFQDFDAFVAEAKQLGLEVAMDIALQASPDHPWLETMPDMFTTRADGTIAYAENPPKKYQDIYPLNFDNNPPQAYAEIRRVMEVWLRHGVKIFRVDNPHTKPVQFWQWLIEDVAKTYPDTIWLAEAFTKPAMMHNLGKAGFQQSYTYYAWRNTKAELEEYLTELSGDAAAYMRPSFWPTTHDILTPYMQYGGPAAWKLRAALAATLVPTYGIYAGYELMEHVARPGAEEQINNEKYEYKDRHWADYEPGGDKAGQSLSGYLTKLNEIRRAHPALSWLRNWTPHRTDDDQILCFSKSRVLPSGERDTIVVVANLDPHGMRQSYVHLDLPALGLNWNDAFHATDLITGDEWHWSQDVYVRLGPDTEPVHIVSVRPY